MGEMASGEVENLDWITFLNEASTWETQVQAESFLSSALALPISLTAGEISGLSRAETYMREQLSALHFGRPLDLTFLNERLSKIHLQVAYTFEGAPEKGKKSRPILPTLRAIATGKESTIQQLVDTWLFQFAHFLGETVDGRAPYAVNRCEALFRKKQLEDCKAFYEKFRSLEESWKGEVLSIATNGENCDNSDELERCACLFQANHGGKFCCDSCRFNSFALRKQIKSPGYQAEKQRRYRERQKSK